ncbi:hypothetical protein RDWZM_000788 [Blomia tropicalis]|uniref:mRNA guanylyltransferase n=1 Tax=Blomia tropicalis TaxID=40697 RepID=A0A9Q0M9J3_BLOTA|nr:hypothetical protein RDWZM_000788 [Blomia tropicalis]
MKSKALRKWKAISIHGNPIEGIFVPFKTPFDNRNIAPEYHFTVQDFINVVKEKKFNVGLVIDLTNTERYYDKSIIKYYGIDHFRLPCRGFDETPSNDEIEEFNTKCCEFMKSNPGKLIAVHCTHGCNRTGFLIVKILKLLLTRVICFAFIPSSAEAPKALVVFTLVEDKRDSHSCALQIGLWIDLTNTHRYYNRRVVSSNGIEYMKINLRGHNSCPSDDQITQFIDICQEFLHQNPNIKIAVHCTHGFNRTGFLICTYLVLIHKWNIEDALNEFARARPPGIYKQDYIDELIRRFGSKHCDRRFLAPELPDWCNEDGLNQSDEDERSNSNGRHSYHSHSQPRQSNNRPSTSSSYLNSERDSSINNPFDGVNLVRDEYKIKQIQRLCTKMCNFDRNGFPGSHPISLTRDNIHLIREYDYMVSWKADGTRYMLMIIGENEMYFIDRNFRVYQLVHVKFLKKNTNESLNNTLLDGEMVIDTVNGKKYSRYLIYDIIYIDNQNVSGYNFRERLDFIYKQVFMPRENAKRTGLIDRSKEPIGIRMKDFCEIKDTYKYFTSKFIKVLSHEIDGLIFQPVRCPYTSGRCDAILKWKPPSHNSIDFRLKICDRNDDDHRGRGGQIGLLFVGQQSHPFAEIEVTKALRNYHNKIVECRYNTEIQGWEFMRERTDKSYPNALETAKAVWRSMVEPVTQQFLLDYIHETVGLNSS